MISPVKSGLNNSNIRFFDMVIKTLDANCRGVSHRKYLREKLIKKEKNHSSIKMKNIKRKINHKDNSKVDIEINKDTIIIEQNEVPLKYKKIMD